ncbi:hypothetical protein JHN46_46475, partial [Streptomyces sp. MBT33]|nr:hypothetical protein [Streptomyces sp. MBT33]
MSSAVEHAVALVGALADFQPQDDVRVLLDPTGHPFCVFARPAANQTSRCGQPLLPTGASGTWARMLTLASAKSAGAFALPWNRWFSDVHGDEPDTGPRGR